MRIYLLTRAKVGKCNSFTCHRVVGYVCMNDRYEGVAFKFYLLTRGKLFLRTKKTSTCNCNRMSMCYQMCREPAS